MLSNFSWVYQEVWRGAASTILVFSSGRTCYVSAAAPRTPIKNRLTPTRPPDCCGPFPYVRRADPTMGTGLIFISWLVGGFVGGLQVGVMRDDERKRCRRGGRYKTFHLSTMNF